ncbi:MAG: DUF362 domain-containing protein, partial [Planctomycetes bacterium]|nr:DUF362 domain-containing protein [Planctomycetota bacterium]
MRDQPAKVSLARCAEYNPAMLHQAVSEVLQPFGGMENLVRPGDKVLLKPNLVMGRAPEKAVNTHPAFVQAVAEQVKDCGGELLLGDSPGLESAAKACRACGLDKVMERVGGRIIEFTLDPDARKQAGFLGDVDMARELREVDVHLNLPKFKTHELTGLTIGVKNCFGTVVGMLKFQWHYRAGHSPELFSKMLVDVYRQAAPQMTIVDAVVGMEGRGPTAGEPRELGFVAAGPDCLALD